MTDGPATGEFSRSAVKAAAGASHHFLLLDPADNILISIASMTCGTVTMLDGAQLVLREDIGLGHKVARHALAVGDKVYRYGFPIGTMTCAVERGGHVHRHNLASDYISAHGREASSAHTASMEGGR